MSNRVFATNLYEFLKEHDEGDYYKDSDPSDCIDEIENYLSDLQMVRETIKDIEGIADSFYDHQDYITDVKPLVEGLREIQEKLEAKSRIRMVGETNYAVKNAIHVGDKEIVFAEDKNAENGMCFFVGDYTSNDIIGEYVDCQIGDDFLEIMQEFTDRVSKQIEKTRDEIKEIGLPHELFTAEHCFPNDYKQSIEGKVVAIKANVFRAEYRRGDAQLVLVNHGNGAKENPRGNAVYCQHLNTGKSTRFERYDVLGEVKPECMPDWAVKKLTVLQAEKSTGQPQKENKDKGDAR